MNKKEITQLLNSLGKSKDRNIVIVDFANVDRWNDSLGWPIGIQKLSQLIKHFSYGKKFLRRFYYGEDFGIKEKNTKLTPWSERIINAAKYNGFELVTKRVKYIPDQKYETGFIKKCNLDVEMAMDLIKEVENYDKAIIFSGDGDLACVIKYLKENFDKKFYVFCARNHLGRELVDAKKNKLIEDILFVEDFEYRLNLNHRP